MCAGSQEIDPMAIRSGLDVIYSGGVQYADGMDVATELSVEGVRTVISFSFLDDVDNRRIKITLQPGGDYEAEIRPLDGDPILSTTAGDVSVWVDGVIIRVTPETVTAHVMGEDVPETLCDSTAVKEFAAWVIRQSDADCCLSSPEEYDSGYLLGVLRKQYEAALAAEVDGRVYESSVVVEGERDRMIELAGTHDGRGVDARILFQNILTDERAFPESPVETVIDLYSDDEDTWFTVELVTGEIVNTTELGLAHANGVLSLVTDEGESPLAPHSQREISALLSKLTPRPLFS